MQSRGLKCLIKRICCFALAVAMIIGEVPLSAYATEIDTDTIDASAIEADADSDGVGEELITADVSANTDETEEDVINDLMEEVPANGASTTSGTLGSDVKWKLELNDDLASRTLTISPVNAHELVAMQKEENQTKYPWYPFHASISKVVFEDGITSIADNAFFDYDNMKEIVFADTIEVIGRGAFNSCHRLTAISLPSHLKTIGYYAFGFCELKEVILPEGTESIGAGAFEGMDLTKIVIPKSVKEIGQGCFNPDTADHSHGAITITVDPANAYYCSIDDVLYTKNKKSLILCGNAVEGTFTIPNGVERIEELAFAEHAGRLQKVIMPDSVTYIGRSAFSGCIALQEIEFSSSLKIIEDNAFESAQSLSVTKLPDSLEKLGAFPFYNTLVSQVVVPKYANSIETGWFAHTKIKNAVIPYGIKAIKNHAFLACKNLTSVSIPKTVEELDPRAFEKCNNLKDIYYGGTEAEWRNIINGMVDIRWLSNITMHYYDGDVALGLSSASKSGNRLKANAKFSDISFEYDPEVVDKVIISNWINDTYGTTVSKTDTVKPRNAYWAYVTIIAKEGHIFRDSTFVTVDGKPCEVFDASADGDRISFMTPTFDAECVHRKNGNLAWEWVCDADTHWQECSVCGETKDRGSHSYDTGTDSGGIKTQHCTVCGNEKTSSNGKTRITKAQVHGGNYQIGDEIPSYFAMNPNYYYSSVIDIIDAQWYKGAMTESNKIDKGDSAVFEDATYTLKMQIAINPTKLSYYYFKDGGINLTFLGGGFKEDTAQRKIENDPNYAGRVIQTVVFTYSAPKKVDLTIDLPAYYQNMTAYGLESGTKCISREVAYVPLLTGSYITDANGTQLSDSTEIQKETTYKYYMWINDIPGYVDEHQIKGEITDLEQVKLFNYNETTKTTSLFIVVDICFTPKTILTATLTMEKPYVGENLASYATVKEWEQFSVTSLEWYKGSQRIYGIEPVQKDVEYRAEIILKAKEDYAFSFEDTLYFVNGLEPGVWVKEDGTVQLEYKFKTVEEHVHEPVLVPMEPGNCTVPGHEQYFICDVCGRAFLDENCEFRIQDLNYWLVTPGGWDLGGAIWDRDAHDFYDSERDGDVADTCSRCGANNINSYALAYNIAKGKYNGNDIYLTDLLDVPGLTYGQEYTIDNGDKGVSVARMPGVYHTTLVGSSIFGYGGRREIEWTISADGMWISMEPSYDYTGKEIKPVVSVYEGETLLTKNKDYKISYVNNKKAFTLREGDEGFAAVEDKAPAVVVTGKGNYRSKEKAYFTIEPMSLEDADVQDITVKHTGSDIKIKPVVKLNGKTLEKGKDYLVVRRHTSNEVSTESYEGVHHFSVMGINNYTREADFDFTITKNKLLSDCTITVKDAPYNDGNIVKPQITVKDGTTKLIEGTHYTVQLVNTEVGSAKVKIIGITPYEGAVRKSFKIKGVSLDKVVNASVKAVEYTGAEITPSVSLTYKKTGEQPVTLVEHRDYELSYKNNTKVGTATITVKGKGRYTGTKKITFKIKPYDTERHGFSNIVINGGNPIIENYIAGGVKPNPEVKLDGKVLVKGKDYTLEYLRNKIVRDMSDANPPLVIVVFKGNYAGKMTNAFTINKQSLTDSRMTVRVPDVVYKNKSKAWESKVVVKNEKGKVLTKDEDYKVTYYSDSQCLQEFTRANHEVGAIAYAAVEGIGNYYTGRVVRQYTIRKGDLTNAEAIVKKQTYKLGMNKITKSDITLTCDGITVPDTEYEILNETYVNYTKAGKAKVTIKGTNNYIGQKVISYTIKPYNVETDADNAIVVSSTTSRELYDKSGAKLGVVARHYSTTLEKGRDYTVSYENNKKVGDANGANPPTAIVKFKGNYTGEKKIHFTIEALSMNAVFADNSDVVYNAESGGWKASDITIRDVNGATLKEGIDYEKIKKFYSDSACTIPFTDADNAVNHYVYFKINAMGKNYKGSTVGYYRIIKQNLANASIKVDKMDWTGSAIKLGESNITVKFGRNGVPLSLGTDYKIVESSYTNNTNRGTAKVTIQGMGNYAGTKTVKFTIIAKPVRWWNRFL